METILTRELLLKSVPEWNKAREENSAVKIDLREADLREADLREADLREADLREADLSEANLSEANLSEANLSEANLIGADLNRASLFRASLIGADLHSANLFGANLIGAGLSGASLIGANLSRASLGEVNMSGADLSRADLSESNLSWADLSGANLSEAEFSGASLRDANLSGADLSRADLSETHLIGANLSWADLSEANLSGADLSRADLSGAKIAYTFWGNVDLSTVNGLNSVRHRGPSTIGIDTIYRSKGNIPEVFLHGCGVPDNIIEYLPSLTGKAFDYYSCFISHGSKDKPFARRLHADLQARSVRCWLDEEDMKSGKLIHDQIERVIKSHEKLLLILSENSMSSEWLKIEIIKAKKREDKEGIRVLFPISIVESSVLDTWELFDCEGRNLADDIRLFYIPSFIGWERDNDDYLKKFEKLLESFNAERS